MNKQIIMQCGMMKSNRWLYDYIKENKNVSPLAAIKEAAEYARRRLDRLDDEASNDLMIINKSNDDYYERV